MSWMTVAILAIVAVILIVCIWAAVAIYFSKKMHDQFRDRFPDRHNKERDYDFWGRRK